MNEITELRDVISTSDSTSGFKTKEAKDHFIKSKDKSKGVVGILHQKITNKDGKEMWKFVGGNDTLIGGTQNIVQNTFANVQQSQLTTIQSMDTEPGMNLTAVSRYLSTNKLIFGFAVGHDGAALQQVYPVKRHTKGYRVGQMLAFQSITASLDNPVENYKKYAVRSIATNGEVQYFVKLLTPTIANISVDSELALPNNPDTAYHGNSDVMTRVTFDIRISPEELVSWWGATYGTTEGGYMNSIMLVAGRACEVVENGQTINTFRDIICTNKINFINKNIKNSKVEIFSYELYYV